MAQIEKMNRSVSNALLVKDEAVLELLGTQFLRIGRVLGEGCRRWRLGGVHFFAAGGGGCHHHI